MAVLPAVRKDLRWWGCRQVVECILNALRPLVGLSCRHQEARAVEGGREESIFIENATKPGILRYELATEKVNLLL